MRLAISNLAWPAEQEATIASLLPRLGITGVEVAPTRIWAHPLEATRSEVLAYRRFWERHCLPIVALQAILFEKPDWRLFAHPVQRRQMTDYLAGMFRLARQLGASVLVFGSPRQRARGSLPLAEALEVAVPFFRELGRLAWEQGTTLCLEPNPTAYGCDFITRAREGLDLVRAVDQPGFALHLDAAGMALSGDVPAETFPVVLPCWRHFHISEPYLAPVGPSEMDHASFAAALHQVGYTGWLSLEMKAPAGGFDPDLLTRVVDFVRTAYQPGALHSGRG